LEERFILYLSVHLQMEAADCSEDFYPLFNYKCHTRGDCVMNYHRPENIISPIVYDPLYIKCAKQGIAIDPLRWQYQERHGLLMWANGLRII
jgi:hypothetical protein